MTRRQSAVLLLLALAFLFGMDVDNWKTRSQIATDCRPQPGEILIAAHQKTDGVTCEFARSYGEATKRRNAH